jgi:hypothetical protein
MEHKPRKIISSIKMRGTKQAQYYIPVDKKLIDSQVFSLGELVVVEQVPPVLGPEYLSLTIGSDFRAITSKVEGFFPLVNLNFKIKDWINEDLVGISGVEYFPEIVKFHSDGKFYYLKI